MSSTVNLGKLFGIQFRLHFTWFIIFSVVTVSLVHPDYGKWLYWAAGIATSLLLFISVVAHELAHSLVGRANGMPIESITLFLFGGVAQMRREATHPAAELKMAVAGPICSVVIGGLFALSWLLIPNIAEPIATMILWLAAMNGVLAAFNLIPGFPLDGGRVFRSLLWRFTGNYSNSTRIATRVGQGIGYSLVAIGISVAFLHPLDMSWFDGIWISLIGWFLGSAASASYRQVRWQEALHDLADTHTITTDGPVTPPEATV